MSSKITFAEWVDRVEKTGRKKDAIAADIGVRLPSLYRYLAQERVPSKKVMRRILALSSGIVDPASFYAAEQAA